MFYYLVMIFTVVPLLELALLLQVGQWLGSATTIALVVLTGVLGATLAKMEGLAMLHKMRLEINQGTMPAARIFDGVLILCAAILLVTPGLITDMCGFLLLIPLTRQRIREWLRHKVQDMIRHGDKITINVRNS